MDTFSNSVLDDIVSHFPLLQNKHNHLANFLELDIPSKNSSNFGGLIIKTTSDKDIWVRNYYKCSAYCVDTSDELIKIMEGVFRDDILWVIGFQEDEWIETTLKKRDVDIEMEKGVTYKVFSWSGNLDRTFKADDI